MVAIFCRRCGSQCDEAAGKQNQLCAACSRSGARHDRVVKEQMRRLPLALVAGALAFLAFPLAILFKGSNAGGHYEVTNRGNTSYYSPEVIFGLMIVALAIVGVSVFFYIRSKDTPGNDEELSIFSDESSAKISADE